MPLTSSARFRLRNATAGWHARVDDVYSSPNLAQQDQYGRFLLAQAAAHLPVEQALEAGGISSVLTDWPKRRRADLIRNDLQVLGLPLPAMEMRPALDDEPSLLGAVYVLEGSRLGGQLLARSVGDGLPAAFLSASRPAAWRELAALLDARLLNRKDLNAAVSAACDVFALFERSGRRYFQGDDFDNGRLVSS